MALYILGDDGEPSRCDDEVAWASWMGSSDRELARDTVGESEIVTLFLGSANEWFDGEPVLWESKVQGGELDAHRRGYSSKAEALRGHAYLCRTARGTR